MSPSLAPMSGSRASGLSQCLPWPGDQVEADDLAGVLRGATRMAIARMHLPTFDEMTRCPPFSKVTVLKQAACFTKARISTEGTRILEVLTPAHNETLARDSARRPARQVDGSIRYSLRYEDAALRIGSPPGAALDLRDAAWRLRTGDEITVDGIRAEFVRVDFDGAGEENDSTGASILVRCDGAREGLGQIGRLDLTPSIEAGGRVYRIPFTRQRQIVPFDVRLPSFEDAMQLEPGTRVTLRPGGAAVRFQSAYLVDGTRQFIVVRARALPGVPTESRTPCGDGADCLHTVRFGLTGLRVAP